MQAGIAEDVAVGVDDALARVAAHRAAAQRVDGDDPAQEPDRVVGEAAAQGVGEVARRGPQAREVLGRALAVPVEVEPAVAQEDPPVGDVAPHPQQRQPARRQLARGQQVGDVAADIGVGRALQPVLDQEDPGRAPGPQRLGGGQHVQDPGELLGVAGVLQVEAAPLAAVERVAHARRARDDRPIAGVDDPRRRLAVDHLAAVEHEREQVAVAAEARPEATAQAREGAAVAQQEVRGAERAGAEHQVVAGDRAQRRRAPVVLGGIDVLERGVMHGVAATLAWLEAAHVAQRAQFGAVVGGVREVVVVERVLGAVVAAHVALAAQLARRAAAAVEVLELLDDRLARHRRAPVVGEGDRELGQEPLEAVGLGCGLEGDGLGRVGVRLVVEGVALQPDHRLDAVVVGVEVLA